MEGCSFILKKKQSVEKCVKKLMNAYIGLGKNTALENRVTALFSRGSSV